LVLFVEGEAARSAKRRLHAKLKAARGDPEAMVAAVASVRSTFAHFLADRIGDGVQEVGLREGLLLRGRRGLRHVRGLLRRDREKRGARGGVNGEGPHAAV
jgi:hypothetical protein